MLHAGLNENIKTWIWPECTAIATKLENHSNPKKTSAPKMRSTPKSQTEKNT